MDRPHRSSDEAHHRFAGDFWQRAGYSRDALPVNRLGKLGADQGGMLFADAFRVGCYFFVVVAALYGTILVLASGSQHRVGGTLVVAGLLLAGAATFGSIGISMLRKSMSDQESGQVTSFCGDLSRWEEPNTEGLTSDWHGLEHGSHTFNLSGKAYNRLPDRAHYRIYFTPAQRNVVNVEEHTDDAPHEWPTSR